MTRYRENRNLLSVAKLYYYPMIYDRTRLIEERSLTIYQNLKRNSNESSDFHSLRLTKLTNVIRFDTRSSEIKSGTFSLFAERGILRWGMLFGPAG